LSVQDFDASLSFLAGEGIPYGTFGNTNGSLQTRPDGFRQIYFKDPFGNWIEFNEVQSGSQTTTPQYDHQGVYVSSLTESGAFYKNILRLEEIKSPWDDVSITRFFSMGNNGELHLVPTTNLSNKQIKGVHISYSVRYFDIYLAFLASKGIEYGNVEGDVGQVDMRPDGLRQIYLQDPYGNWIEINDAQ
jgi:catechol 2,3-dioxygenase-like lactoylglutathione lyase family enzyme